MYELLAAIVTGAFSVIMVWMSYRLNQIHTLVNSNMTVALKAALSALVTARFAKIEVIAMRRQAGTEPSIEVMAELADIDMRILEAKEALAGRK